MRKIIFSLLWTYIFAFNANCQFTWRTENCLPTPHYQPVMFALGNQGYIVGGATRSAGGYEVANQVWEYDASTNVFTQKNNFPRIINCAVGFVLNGIAYVGTGVDSIPDNYKNDFWKYDPVADQWTQVADFPIARYNAMAFAINGVGYVGCGFNGSELNDFYAYNPISDTWDQKANFAGNARQTGFGIGLDGYGYMGLGWDGTADYLNDVYQYDPILDTWSQIANFPSSPRQGGERFTIADSFYLTGGTSYTGNQFNDCWRYDPSSNTWAVQEDIACVSPAFVNIGGFAINGCGYVLNGYFGNDNYGATLLKFGPLDTTFIERVYVFGNDTNYCGSFPQTLSTENSCTVWSTGVVGSQIVVTGPGTYWARWPDTCGMVADTIQILQGGFPVSLSIQNSVCDASDGAATVAPYGGTPPFVYSWANGDTTATISHLKGGIYAVTVTDSSGCISTATAIVDSSAIGNVTITADTTTFCAGSGTPICAPTGFLSYSWNTGQNTNCIYAQEPGNYYVTVNDGGDCSAVSNHILITVLSNPSISITVRNDTLICYNGLAYQWYLNDTVITGATSNLYVAQVPGDYSVMLVDSNGCTAESNGVKILTVGITNIEAGENITIYPNPLNQGNWTLEVPMGLIGSRGEVYDSKGSLVSGFNIESLKTPLNLVVSSGVYFMRIITGSNTYLRKLIKL